MSQNPQPKTDSPADVTLTSNPQSQPQPHPESAPQVLPHPVTAPTPELPPAAKRPDLRPGLSRGALVWSAIVLMLCFCALLVALGVRPDIVMLQIIVLAVLGAGLLIAALIPQKK